MKEILIVIGLMLVGCQGGDTYVDSNTSVVSIPSDTTLYIDENQTIGYMPNTDVSIINVGDNGYYISCDGSDNCSIHIGNIDDNSDNSNVDDNSDSSTNTTNSYDGNITL